MGASVAAAGVAAAVVALAAGVGLAVVVVVSDPHAASNVASKQIDVVATNVFFILISPNELVCVALTFLL
ncbi:hypothetical protein D3C86_2122310 [compost metagenome]